MAVAEVHPGVEELVAFTLGTLEDETDESIGDHIASCPSCQELAANAPDDAFVELLRNVHARRGFGTDSVAGTAAQSQTPPPQLATDQTGELAPAVAPAAQAESDRLQVPDALPADLARHERYRVVRLLGSGGMGAVYAAEHRVMQRLVALKVMKPAYTASPAALERFRHEVRAAARLSHPNIVMTHDAEDAGETNFLVMEFVEGTDLGRLVQERGLLPVDRACDYVRQAALGLQYAFEQGMVHRDLKPHNLMLTPDGRIKILDFGLSRFASEAADAAGLTSTGIVLGTVDYIAPEQADNARQADIRSDIYSLGCTLYHLLAGRPPFSTGTALQKVLAHVEKKPLPLTELRPDLPEKLMLVLDRMMAKNPMHRYQTPGEVALALQSFLDAPPVARQLMPRLAERTMDIDGTGLTKEPARNRRRPTFAIAAAFLAFFVISSLGVCVYRIATDNGELIIETDNDDVEVVVSKGGKVVKLIDTKSGKHFTLDSGEYELALKGDADGLVLSRDKMTLKRGDTVLAKISRRNPHEPKPNPGEPVTEPPVARRPPEGVVAWWPANANAKDSVGNNHGTLKGGVTFAPGVAGQAFRLDGATRYVEVPRSDLWGFGRRDFSIELWVQFRAVARSNDVGHPSAIFIGCDEGPGARDKWFFGYGDGLLNFIFGKAGKGGSYAKAEFSPDLDQWYHLAVTRSRGTFTIYVDGVPVASEKVDLIMPNPDAPLTIGQAEGLGFVSGLIDEVAIYDRALSPAEVKARWSALAPAHKPLEKKVREIRRFEGHKNGAFGVAFSPDGRYALSGAGDGIVRLSEVATGREVRQFVGHEKAVFDVAFSPDGRQALTTSEDQTVRLWDVGTGKEIRVLKGNAPGIGGMAFLPDGRRAVSVCAGGIDGSVRLWDLESGEELRRITVEQPRGVAVSSDGRRALSASWRINLVKLWDLETGAMVREMRGHTSGVNNVAFLPEGRQALSTSNDRTLRLWDLDDGLEIHCLSGHTDAVNSVVITRDGRCAVSASNDKTVRVWDLQTGKELHCFKGHTGAVMGVAVSPDGRYALSGSHDGTMRLWQLSGLPNEPVGEVRRFEGHTGDAHCVAYSPDGRYAVSGSGWPTGDGTIRLWDVATGKQIHKFDSLAHARTEAGTRPSRPEQNVLCVAFSPDGRHIVYGGDGNTAVLLDVATGKEVWRFAGFGDAVLNLAFSPNGRQIIAAGQDCLARVLDADTGKELCKFEGHVTAPFIRADGSHARVMQAAFTPDGKRAVSGGDDGTIYLWDVKTGEKLQSFEGSKGVGSVAISPGGRYVLSSSFEDQPIRLWDMATGKLVREFIGHKGVVFRVAFSHDGCRVISGSSDKTVRLWDAATGKELHCFAAHTDLIKGVAFSPDDRYAISASQDKSLRLWRLPEPPVEQVGEVRRFEGHTGDVWHVALSADGRFALSVGSDQTARLWDVATGAQLYCFEGISEDNLGVAFSPDSKTAFCGSGGEVHSWEVATGKERAPLRSPPARSFPNCGRIRSVAISDDGRKLLGAGIHAAVLWDLQTGKVLQNLDKSGWIHCGALSGDGTQILTGADGAHFGPPSMRLWDAKTGQEIRRFAGHINGVGDVVFSPDGRLCVSGEDSIVRVFDVASGKELLSIPHAPHGLRRGAFLPDGQRFLSTGGDGGLYLWDLRNGQKLHSFKGHTGLVYAVAVSRDGRYALSSGVDKTVRLWRLPDLPAAKENP
jgi:WD40 repeat protein